MKFLSDAHISADIVECIRTMGHDCQDWSTIPARMLDVEILSRAAADGRVVITADKDFGELVFVFGIQTPGVVLLRLPYADESQRVDRVRTVWPVVVGRLPGSFITVTQSSVRARPLPS